VNNISDQLDATITMLLISESAQHVLGQKIARNILSWFKNQLSRYCCISLVIYIIHLHDALSDTNLIFCIS